MLASRALAGDLAFVTSQNAEMVTLVDTGTGAVLARTPVAGKPAPVAYDPAAGRAYVIAADTGRLSVLDETGAVTATRDLGEGAFGLAVAPEGGLFVTDWFGARLLRLDRDLRQVWAVPTGAAPAGVAVSDDGRMVATADRDDDGVSIFDAATGALLHRVKTAGAHPFGITFHDGRFWTADVQGDTVSVIDAATGKLVGSVPTGSHPYAVGFAGGRGFVTNQYAGTLTVFDPATLKVLAEVPIGDYPEGISPLPGGRALAVANWDSDTLVLIDADSLEITAEIAMPAGPRAFGQFTGRQARP
ncbi:PQQ-binding-like beta-propeller repeat protein [Paracoccus sp. YIM 132242]|uniref:PQQ-binding-like beta-propeller repeat protein n=1 Tax=Paracoccus lichenicola TaxID=2665644 RepID=A0A6L6HNV9_9RHOB|nr:YncE family protein [Paracoccus lichenicola]MTE00816.1 PQQ-binding-like beta-propeller repeat protein [Paracoccus lichenicola]